MGILPMTRSNRRPPAQPDLANVFVTYQDLFRTQIEPPKPTRRRLIRSTPIINPFR